MRIESVHIHGFGLLRDCRVVLAPDKLNLVCEPNEAGKSTLTDAIVHSFYDFPTRGMQRATLRPRDRYRPWDASAPYKVEMLLQVASGQRLRLTADFARSKPYELFDLTRGLTVDMEGLPFGERHFRMGLEAFVATFVLRQMELTDRSNAGLASLVELAASTGAGLAGGGATARRALERLDALRLDAPDFARDQLTPDNLLKRIETRTGELAARLNTLRGDFEARTAEIGRADEMDAEIAEKAARLAVLEHAGLAAELEELRGRLARHEEAEAGEQRRITGRAELEPFARYAGAPLAEARGHMARAEAARVRLEGIRARAGTAADVELDRLEAELAAFPPSLAEADAHHAVHLRALGMTHTDQTRELARLRQRLEEARSAAVTAGVPMDQFDHVRAMLPSGAEADMIALIEHERSRGELEKEIAGHEAAAAEASARVTEARSRRQTLRMKGGFAMLAALALALLVALLLLLHQAVGAVAASLAVIAAAGAGVWMMHLAQMESARRLEPAQAAEITAASELARLRQRLGALVADFEQTMRRRDIGPDEIAEIRRLGDYSQLLAPYRSALALVDRQEASLAGVRGQIAEIARLTAPDTTAASVDDVVIARAQRNLDDYLEKTRRRESLLASTSERRAELDAGNAEMETAHAALDAILENFGVPPGTRAERLEALEQGVGKAELLNRLDAGGAATAVLTPEEAATLRRRAGELETRLAAMPPQPPGTLPSTGTADALRDEATRLVAEREELRVARERLFADCDRAVDTWRREQPQLEADMARLEERAASIREFTAAATIAREELAALAEGVYTTWATELNRRANEILPLVNANYRELEFDDHLDWAVKCAATGRRLAGRELMHLSRGAADQLELSVRVAIGEFVASGAEPPPIILDEPFAHWDDARFEGGVRFLADLASRHQVILLTCHAWRFERLLRDDPVLAERIARHGLTGAAPSTAGA